MRPISLRAWPVMSLRVVWGALGILGGPVRAEAPPIIIRAVEGLRFDPPRVRVEAGRPLRLRFENADTTAQPHNLVVVRPGTREAVLAAALALGADGPARGYVPAGADVIGASRLLAAGDGEEVVVSLPEEPGIYPIVCTFPGHGVLMFGAIYAGVEMPGRLEDDAHVPKPPPPPVIDADSRPMVRRMFLPHAGPAAVAVALPGDLNLCWDAGTCRLRYVWRGGFLDAEKHFTSKGQSLARLGGPVVATAPDVFPVRLGGRAAQAVRFRGYTLENGLPVFSYTLDGQLVKEGFSADNGVLVRRFQIPKATADVDIHDALGPSLTPTADRGNRVDGMLRVSPAEAEDVTLRYALPDASETGEALQ